MTPAERIKDYLESNGIKQTFLANKIDMHPNTLNAKLNGHVRILADDIEKICGALGISPNAFLKPRKGVGA